MYTYIHAHKYLTLVTPHTTHFNIETSLAKAQRRLCMRAYACILYTYICIYIYIYTYLYTHTYTCTHIYLTPLPIVTTSHTIHYNIETSLAEAQRKLCMRAYTCTLYIHTQVYLAPFPIVITSHTIHNNIKTSLAEAQRRLCNVLEEV